MKRVYFTLTLMSLFGGLNAFAQTYKTIGGVRYGLMQDGKTCIVIGDDNATGDITFKKEVEIDGSPRTVTGVCGSGDYSSEATDQKKGFSDNANITSITFEEGSQITWIGDHAFKSCSKLKTINNVPAGLNFINTWCFEGTALESVDLSNTKLQYLPNGCFYNCSQLKEVKLPSTLTTPNSGEWVEADDAKYGKQAFQFTAIESIDLTNTNIISLGDYMFAECPNLKTVKLPSTLKYIWHHAFYKSSLSSITLPRSLEQINEWAFQETHLENVVIPTKTRHIGDGAFDSNNNLKTVVINGLECYLAVCAFAKCDNLKDVYITSDNEPLAGRYGYPFEKNPTVHVVPNYLETFKGLRNDKNENPCNTTNFDTNLSIKLDKEWTTLTSAYNLDFSNVKGLTAYAANYDETKDAVALTQVNKAPAHKGLILKGEAGKTYKLPILKSNEFGLELVTYNQLVDCVDAVWSSNRDKDYFLHNGEFVKSTNDGWALPGKSFLYISGGRTNKSESPLRVYVDNTATAINGITNNPVVKDDAYYNLQGVKVQRPQHGVFIHNGKKVVLK